MPPVKVLHLIPTLSSGGAERQLANLVTNTERELVEHAVCVINDSAFFAPTIIAAGYRVIDLGLSAKHPFFSAAFKFRKVIAEEKPDILHSWLYDANIATRFSTFPQSRTPIVTSLQLADYEPEAMRLAGWNSHKVRVLRMIDKLTERFTKPFFVPCSQFVGASYQRHFGMDKNRSRVIYNSVDAAPFSADGPDVGMLRDELALPSDAFVYLNVGRLDPQKNHKTMFAAFRQVLNKTPQPFLLLAGVGGLESELRELSRVLGIDERVRFLGRRNDIGALLELADVFVFPSLFEGLPVALVEAMFKRRACIASRIEVFEEIVVDGKTALLVDPLSADKLAAAMIDLHQNADLRRSLGEQAYWRANDAFSASTTARQWEQLYAEISREPRFTL